ncbi:MAG: DUF2339 domain-containing protein [Bacteroidota bacterium]
MENSPNDELKRLRERLQQLESSNSEMYYELRAMKSKLDALMTGTAPVEAPQQPGEPVEKAPEPPAVTKEEVVSITQELKEKPVIPAPVTGSAAIPPVQQQGIPAKPLTPPKPSKTKQDWERFIGENLINKIGILITIIGVSIGSKYAIDHQLISPMMRILIGYAIGGGLLFFAFRLKAKYLDFSAVLLSGAMAIVYFLTFIAYSFYHFFSIEITFLLMVVFTGFTVFSAIRYDRQIIAHLGLVGAYAVPFLLSDGSGKIGFFYSYIAVINAGILVISFLRNWKPLLFVAFGFTWGIFLLWYGFSYSVDKHFNFAVLFSAIFFLTFYAAGLAYKVIKHEKFNAADIFLITGNSFLFFGLGYLLISTHGGLDNYLGLFCVLNAILHFGVSLVLFRNKLVDKTIFYLVSSMVLFFITITIPVQFEGNVVTLTWTFEALMLFALGRLKKIDLFEKMSFPILILAFLSIIVFWVTGYGADIMTRSTAFSYSGQADIAKVAASLKHTFLFNSRFLTSFCFMAALGLMYYIHKTKGNPEEYEKSYFMSSRAITIVMLLIAVFTGLFLEINQYWDIKETAMKVASFGQRSFLSYNSESFGILSHLSKIGFILAYLGTLMFIRRNKENSAEFNVILAIASNVALVLFLTFGIYELRHLKFHAVFAGKGIYSSALFVFVRCFSYLLFGLFVYVSVQFLRSRMNSRLTELLTTFTVHFCLFLCLFLEIGLYWEISELRFRLASLQEIHRVDSYNLGIMHAFATISKIAFTLLFFGIMLFRGRNKENSSEFKNGLLILSVIAILVFLVVGLYDFSFLQLNYLFSKNEYYAPYSLVLVRYVMYGLFAAFMLNFLHFVKTRFSGKAYPAIAEFILHLVLVWVISSELVNWMHVFNSKQVYKLGLSIFWGIYSLGLVSYGIWKKKSVLRIGAFSLFGLTLIKLFVYDLSHMTTISKTIVFIALGILLLIISFLYNKYKSVLFEENEK